jgi:putative ABC transport system permease protein
MLRNYIKVSLRLLLRKKLFSMINISGLALGLSVCMLIALYVFYEYNFDRFHKNEGQIFRITAQVNENNNLNRQFGGSNGKIGAALKTEIPDVKDFVRTISHPLIVKTNSEIFEEEALFADKNFLNIFTFPLIAGNPESALDQINSVVLTKNMALKFFNTVEVEGKVVELKIEDQFAPFIVTGVTENIPGNSSIQFNILLPIGLDKDLAADTQWLGFPVNTFCVLNKASDYKRLEPKINQFYQRKIAQELTFAKKNAMVDLKIKLSLQPINQIHLNEEYVDNSNGVKNGSKPVYSFMLMAIATFILIIACINFINLSVAGSLKRNKEIGIRKVIGGERFQIVTQFLGESVVLCFIAFIVALLLTTFSLPTFNILFDRDFNISSLFSIKLLGIYFLLLLITGLVAGFYPALVLSGHNPVKNFKNQQNLTSNNYFGKTLIIVQFLFATFLVVGTVIIYQQYNFLYNKDLGYQDEHPIEIPLSENANRKTITLFKNELASNSSVKELTGLFHSNQDRIKIDGREIDCESVWVDPNYLNTYGIKLIEGRDFLPNFSEDPLESVIVNEAFLKESRLAGHGLDTKFGYLWRSDKSKIIGVVKDYHFQSLREKIKPLIINLNLDRQYRKAKLIVKVAPGSGASSVASIEKVFKSILPYAPFSYNYIEDLNTAYYRREEQWKQIIFISAGLAILVSCIGLLGLTVLATENRSKEVGIRKVLGSSSLQIIVLFLTDFLRLVLIGVTLAMPVAWFAQTSWLVNFAYKVDISWWNLALCGAGIIMVSIVPIIFQAFQASLKNPVEVLNKD